MVSFQRAMLSGALALGLLIQPCVAQEREKPNRLWKLSVVALVAAHALDFVSSRGRIEANPLMRAPTGSFSWQRGLMVKSSVSAVTITMQILMRKKSPGGQRSAAIVNFGSAAAIGGIAAHNLRIARADMPRVSRPDTP